LLLYSRGFVQLKNILFRFSLDHKVGLFGYDGDIGFVLITILPIE